MLIFFGEDRSGGRFGSEHRVSIEGRKFSRRPIQQTSLRLHCNGGTRSESSNFWRLRGASPLLSAIKSAPTPKNHAPAPENSSAPSPQCVEAPSELPASGKL